VDKFSGKPSQPSLNDFKFSGRVKSWYETLPLTVLDGIELIQKRHFFPPTLLEAGQDAITILKHTEFFTPVANEEHDGLFANFLKVKEQKEMPRNEIRISLCSHLKANEPRNGKVTFETLEQPKLQDEVVIEILDMSTL